MNHIASIRPLTVVIALLLLTVPAVAAGPAHGGNQLPGTWEVNVEPDPASGVPSVLNFSLITRDGQIISEDPNEGTSLGGWAHDGRGVYSVTFYGFIPAAGLRHRVVAEVTMSDSGNAFSGPFTSDVYDMQGTQLFSFDGQVSATRLSTP